MKIAIIGAGIAGLAAARLLHRAHDVTIYERRTRPGGHSRTITLDLGARQVAVDTGFIVYNEVNYPRLTGLFAELDVATSPTCMSFGVSARGGRMEWSSKSIGGLFAVPGHLVHPPFLRMLAEIVRFNRLAARDLRIGVLDGYSLGSYVAWRGFGSRFRDHYLVPMGAAIWCMPGDHMQGIPAETFLRFFQNHGLLGAGRHRWRTVEGGSGVYVERLTASFQDLLRTGCPVAGIRRTGSRVAVVTGRDQEEWYDQAVLACHSDTALALLDDADMHERQILGALRYSANDIYLHRDPALMPWRRRAWSSWNVVIPEAIGPDGRRARFGVTYWMNRLQNIEGDPQLFVSVNPAVPPRDGLTFDHCRMDHPCIDRQAIDARRALPAIQGRRRVWFCGAYTGHGFHEDGLRSGEEVARSIMMLAGRQSEQRAAAE